MSDALTDQDLRQAMSELPPLVADAMARHYGLDGHGVRTFAQVGDELGISRSDAMRLVYQAHDLILAILRDDQTRRDRDAA